MSIQIKWKPINLLLSNYNKSNDKIELINWEHGERWSAHNNTYPRVFALKIITKAIVRKWDTQTNKRHSFTYYTYYIDAHEQHLWFVYNVNQIVNCKQASQQFTNYLFIPIAVRLMRQIERERECDREQKQIVH